MCKEGVTTSIAHYPKFNFSKVDRKKGGFINVLNMSQHARILIL